MAEYIRGGQAARAACPSCGATLDVPPGRGDFFCMYCGAPVHAAAAPVADDPAPAPAPAPGAGPAPLEIRDPATGMGLLMVTLPDGWSCASCSVARTATSSQPLMPRAVLRGPGGAAIEFALGEAGDRLDGPTRALMAMGGRHLAGIDRTNYAEMPDPLALEQRLAAAKAREAGLSLLGPGRWVQPPVERLAGVRQAVLEGSRATARQAGGLAVEDAMCCEVIRTYEAEAGGEPWGMATAVRLVATRFGLGGMAQLGGMAGGLGDMLAGALGGLGGQAARQPGRQGGGIGSFLMGGGLVGQMMREGQARQAPGGAMPAAAPGAMPLDGFEDWEPPAAGDGRGRATGQAPAAPAAWSVPDIASFDHGNVSWEVSVMAAMIAPAGSFADALEGAFLPMLGASGVHPDVKAAKARGLADQQAQTRQATGAAILRNQQMTQATLAAARERGAAFQSHNDAWSARSDARHAASRAASGARFEDTSGTGGPGDFAEAMRGVNTFVTSDGREVELDVAAEAAYENRAGEVVGGPEGFDPGADWTRIPQG